MKKQINPNNYCRTCGTKLNKKKIQAKAFGLCNSCCKTIRKEVKDNRETCEKCNKKAHLILKTENGKMCPKCIVKDFPELKKKSDQHKKAEKEYNELFNKIIIRE